MAELEPLPKSKEMQDVARRVVWFEPPEKALENPILFMTQLMTYGHLDDVVTVMQHVPMSEFEKTLDDPVPGIFDRASWRFWNAKCGRDPDMPLPERKL